MKTSAIVLATVAACAALSAPVFGESAGKHVRVHSHHGKNKFKAVERLKATPWDTEPETKIAKCDDLQFLLGFYSFEESVYCRDDDFTDLCMKFRLARVALEAVIYTAECPTQHYSGSSSSSNSSNSDN
ncbi:hypothetical protein PINS_up023388 [Pythium insidiosum]|nr:hypothetical protein PINS_up023388 [Pythium insidiosum]